MMGIGPAEVMVILFALVAVVAAWLIYRAVSRNKGR